MCDVLTVCTIIDDILLQRWSEQSMKRSVYEVSKLQQMWIAVGDYVDLHSSVIVARCHLALGHTWSAPNVIRHVSLSLSLSLSLSVDFAISI